MIELRQIPIRVAHVEEAADLESARLLFLEYAQSLNFSLCFQGFEQELLGLPGRYEAPGGRLLLAKMDGWPVGCIALRELEPGIGEIKRLYVLPFYRTFGIGRVLATSAIQAARRIGYDRLRLDTTRDMVAARRLYESLGFAETAPYNASPLPGIIYMELLLQRPASQ